MTSNTRPNTRSIPLDSMQMDNEGFKLLNHLLITLQLITTIEKSQKHISEQIQRQCKLAIKRSECKSNNFDHKLFRKITLFFCQSIKHEQSFCMLSSKIAKAHWRTDTLRQCNLAIKRSECNKNHFDHKLSHKLLLFSVFPLKYQTRTIILYV